MSKVPGHAPWDFALIDQNPELQNQLPLLKP